MWDAINNALANLVRRVSVLEQRMAKIPVRTAGGGGSARLSCDEVDELPAIDHSGLRLVKRVAGDASHRDQVWMAYEGDSEWSPQQRLTDIDGSPE
jgi:hypothetical protein